MSNSLSWFLDRLFLIFGVTIFLQIPQYTLQYETRLAGHVEELRLQIDSLTNVAKKTDKTLNQYIKKFLESGDKEFKSQGEWMQALSARWEKLHRSHEALSQAYVFKLFYLLIHLDRAIAKETWHAFEWGMNFTLESLFYAIIGAFFGYFLFWGFKQLIDLLHNALRKKDVLPPAEQ